MHDHHLPQFHIRLPRGYLNDPNGPIQLGDTTHLYFQSRPYPELDVPVEWGHATSTDLVHWTLHRPALSPVPGGLDSGGCWSGNTVVEGDRIRAFYSGKVDNHPYQSVLTALSDKNGAHFTRPAQLVKDPNPAEGVTMFRDPFVWRAGATWYMVVGAANPDSIASMRQYDSDDGITWRHIGDLAQLQRTIVDGVDTGEGWECPQLIPVDTAEVALVSSWSHADGPGKVLAFPLGNTPTPRVVDDGHNFYAASVMREGTYGPILFGWITEGRETTHWKNAGWAGAISLPRRVWMDAGRLLSAPHQAVEALRIYPSRPGHDATIGAQVEILLPPHSGTTKVIFRGEEQIQIVVDTEANTLTLNRSTVGDGFDDAPALIENAYSDREPWAARIFVDGSLIEIFTNAGRTITSRFYSTGAPPWHIEAPLGTLVWDLAPALSSASSKNNHGMK